MKKRIVEVKPIFSLSDKRLEGLIDAEVLVYQEVIEKSLLKYKIPKNGKREIEIEKLSLRLRGISSIRPTPLEKVISNLLEEESVGTPFLLGLATNQKFLMGIRDAQSIEIFERQQLFLGKFNRPSQLCLRRGPQKWVLSISTFVFNDKVNEGERESPNSINTLYFVEEKKTVNQEEDLSEKIIG